MSWDPLHRSSGQTQILTGLLKTAAELPGLAVLDLDSCLLDNRTRQLVILRQFASRYGQGCLYRVTAAHLEDWDLRATVLRAGLSADWWELHGEELEAFWKERFFSNEYQLYDQAMPGAATWVHELRAAGLEILYLTGRTEDVRENTARCLALWGFPRPGREATLWMKPVPGHDDHLYKGEALARASSLPRILLDNEPVIVNHYQQLYPEAEIIWVDSDHSPRPDRTAPSIPRIHGFLR